MSHPDILPSAEPTSDVEALCCDCGTPYSPEVTWCPERGCTGRVRRLAQPITAERLAVLKRAGSWKNLRLAGSITGRDQSDAAKS